VYVAPMTEGLPEDATAIGLETLSERNVVRLTITTPDATAYVEMCPEHALETFTQLLSLVLMALHGVQQEKG